MPDRTLFTAALSSLKTATEIAKTLRDNDLAVEKAELKLRLAEIIGALADARMELAELQQLVSAKDGRIAELEQAFANKDTLVRHHDAYYRVDEDGKPAGVPFCLRCWEVDHQQRQLVHSAVVHRRRVCTLCKTEYEGTLASRLGGA